VKSIKFGEPEPTDDNSSAEASLNKLSRTSAGVADVSLLSNKAAAPATCGQAIEVPDMVLDAVSELLQAEVIKLPGAKTSKQAP